MTYLENGWFEPDGDQKLRSDVIDGAMDIAGMMIRAEVGAELSSLLEGSKRVLNSRAPDAFSIRAGPSVLGAGAARCTCAHSMNATTPLPSNSTRQERDAMLVTSFDPVTRFQAPEPFFFRHLR